MQCIFKLNKKNIIQVFHPVSNIDPKSTPETFTMNHPIDTPNNITQDIDKKKKRNKQNFIYFVVFTYY